MNYLAIALKAKTRWKVQDNPDGLIDRTLREINEAWEPGTVEWIKANRPDEWRKLLTLEQRINRMALGGNLNGLRGGLNEYQSLILAMVKEFKSPNEKKGQEMFNFVERPMSPGMGERWVK